MLKRRSVFATKGMLTSINGFPYFFLLILHGIWNTFFFNMRRSKCCLCAPFACLTATLKKVMCLCSLNSSYSWVLQERDYSTWVEESPVCKYLPFIRCRNVLQLQLHWKAHFKSNFARERMMRTGQPPVSPIAQHINPSDSNLEI